jgi:hypothetical protein
VSGFALSGFLQYGAQWPWSMHGRTSAFCDSHTKCSIRTSGMN